MVSRRDKTKDRLNPPPGEDFWVFGYGSLMWDPGFPHLEVRPALLDGYYRHFCLYSHVYRGTPGCPGLVLGLDKGGSCRGLVYRIPAGEGEDVMDYLHEREMVTEVYSPEWLTVSTDEGSLEAAAFVVDTGHEQYAGRLPEAEIIDLILQGNGDSGPCLDYLENTVRHLDAMGLSDDSLSHLLARVRERLSG